jgi:phage/plasmid-like protein (TIGR03299 family)
MTAERHHIETIGGTALAVFNRQPAWHRLGTVLDEPMSVEDAMTAAHLSGWNVRHAELLAQPDGADGGLVPVTAHRATIRTNPITGLTDVLGVTSDNYSIVQNEEAFAFAQNVLDVSGTTVEAAGSLRGGKQVWMLLHMPEDVVLSGGDVVRPYLLATTAHDGSAALTVQATTIRVVCANTLKMSLGAGHPTYRVRHTSGAQATVAEARSALDLGWRSVEEFNADAERWISTEVSSAQWLGILDDAVAKPLADSELDDAPKATKAANTRAVERRAALDSLYLADRYSGTAWGALNAFTEYADHYSRPNRTDVQRAESAVGPWGDKFKDVAVRTIGRALIPA